VFCDREVHDASALVRKQHEHEQQPIRRRRDDEEVSGHDLLGVGREERSPRRRRRTSAPAQVIRDGGLTHAEAKLPQLAGGSDVRPRADWRRPSYGSGTDVRRHTRPPRSASALPSPNQPEAAAVPADDGVRFHEHEPTAPFRPDTREPDPEDTVGCGETSGRSAGAFKDQKLMSERENLAMQRPRASAPATGWP
jgi:hypothetical protein